MIDRRLQVFSGNANPTLASRICAHLKIPLGQAVVGRFPDGEIEVKVTDDVRGSAVYVVQPTSPPVNDNIMELLLMVDCLRRASAASITAVIPYYGYARKDRKEEGRVPISAKVVANLLVGAGAGRVVAMDLHAAQIQGFFDIPVDHLYAAPVLVEYLRTLQLEDLTVVAPDVGSIRMAHGYARRLGAELAIVEKRRISGTKTRAAHFIGDVSGRNVVIVDDIIATAGSMISAAELVRERGARSVRLCATHAVLAGDALSRLAQAPVEEIIVSDTIESGDRHLHLPRLTVLSVAELLGEAIARIHTARSVSALFT